MIKAPSKINLHSIRTLMVLCQVLLVVFTIQWLSSQYDSQREELKKNLTKIFTDIQNKVSDSLILEHVIEPVAADVPADNIKTLAAAEGMTVSLSPGGVHKALTKATPISHSQAKNLFRMDTIAFNELFASQMKENGWDFQSQWVNNNDSNKSGKAIFIKSDFFTQDNGIAVKDYGRYLLWMLLPQILFITVLLVLTATAFIITYRGLRSQIKLSQLKDDFISNMSHELKTPISTVKLALEALTNYNALDDAQRSREYLGMATSEMDRLELLATRVLNTSLLENGKLHLQKESHDLGKLVDDVLQSMQLRLAQHNARVSFSRSGNSFTVPVDKLHMQGVLVNLLDNSLKYAVQPPAVHISLTEENGHVQLSLSDDGPGIPEEYREKIFEKFFRVPNGLRHNTKGYGLGLSYAAQVMRQHNGSINVNNVATGGCVFTLTF